MINNKKAGLLSLLAAIFFAAYAFFDILNYLISDIATVSFKAVVAILLCIGMAVALFIKNKIAVTAVSGAYALYYFIIGIIEPLSNVSSLRYAISDSGFAQNTAIVLAFAALFFTALLSLLNKKAAKYISLTATAFKICHFLIVAVGLNSIYFFYSRVSTLRFFYTIFINILMIAALAFAGLWAAESVVEKNFAKVAPAVPYAAPYAAPTYGAPAYGAPAAPYSAPTAPYSAPAAPYTAPVSPQTNSPENNSQI